MGDIYMRLPAASREDAVTLMEGIKDPELRAAFVRLLATVRRVEIKSASDREGDRNRRTLVGTHIPKWRADQYKKAAKRQRLSLHAWVCQALDEAAARQGMGKTIDGPPESESSHQSAAGEQPSERGPGRAAIDEQPRECSHR